MWGQQVDASRSVEACVFFFFFFKKTKQKTIKTGKPLWLLHHDTINKGVFFKGERKKKGREMMKDGYLCMMAFL